KFYALPDDYPLRVSKGRGTHGAKKNEDTAKLIKYIDDNVIGKNTTFSGPYGRRKARIILLCCIFIFCGPLVKELRKRLVKCFVWSVALYGPEIWTLRRSEEKRIEAFEMWICV
ncbi:hypothetical protein ANN_13411, partial [Periplaneta americana]